MPEEGKMKKKKKKKKTEPSLPSLPYAISKHPFGQLNAA